MQTSQIHSHRRAQEELEDKGLLAEVMNMPNAPLIAVTKGTTGEIKNHFESRWRDGGWAIEPAVDPDLKITINAMKQGVALTVQTGYITRPFYDLLKFQAMYLRNKINVAILMLPTAAAASTFGSNFANFSRVTAELELFFHIITVPVLIISFE